MAASPDTIRTLATVNDTNWTDAVLNGAHFIGAGNRWLTWRLSEASLTYAGLEPDDTARADCARECWVAAKVCEVEARRAAKQGKSFKAGPISLGGLDPDEWRIEAEILRSQAAGHLAEIQAGTVTVEWSVVGWKFTTADFGDETEHDYYTFPDDLVLLTPKSNRAEDNS